MNIDNIKCFISLAECLNFTKAAEKEHVTQTSMSRRISSLETELGAPLFYRDNRMVELTAAGKVFYDQAKKLVEFYDQSVYMVQNANQGFIRELKLGFGLYEDRLLSPFLRHYAAQNAKVRISCMQFRYHQLLDQFQRDLIDVMITSDQFLNEIPTGDTESYLVHEAPWNLGVHRRNPLSDFQAIPAQAMQDQVIITMYEGSAAQITDYYRKVFPFRDFIYVNSFSAKVIMIQANLGVGLFPAFISFPENDEIQLRPLVHPHTPRKFYVLCKKKSPKPTCSSVHKEMCSISECSQWLQCKMIFCPQKGCRRSVGKIFTAREPESCHTENALYHEKAGSGTAEQPRPRPIISHKKLIFSIYFAGYL